MFFIKKVVSSYNSIRLKGIERFMKHPEETQLSQFRHLIKQGKNTSWGKEFDYSSIKTFSEYQQRVPLMNYEKFTPYIIRLRQGEKNLLWPGEIKWFAKSSGTTNSKSKFIPISKESLVNCHFKGGHDVFAIYNNRFPNTKLYSGRTLTLGGSHKINNFNIKHRTFYGDLSAILIENLPIWTNFYRTPRRKIALMSEWEQKMNLITQTAIRKNVTALMGVPSWFLALLRHILNQTGKKNLLEIWPNLELFIHGGVSFKPYRSQYKDLIPTENMHYMETYNASEGFFGIQDDFATKDMLLMLDYGIFYEFLPLSAVHSENPKTLSISEVEEGIDYAIIISTNGGLWRYMIGDTIRFTSLNPYKIIISGRTRHYINAFGEELIIDNAEIALEKACLETGAVIKEYTAAPIYMTIKEKGAHQWLIEFEKEPKIMAKFTKILDEALKEQNSDYEAKRYKCITLDLPIVVPARQNLFFEWLKKRNKLGGQNKIPRLANERDFMEELLILNEKL
ncbi:MAG: GH3 auxin-responsive promoter family protein [Marinilabiliaceae bacterium]|nr:GH3 auxin-responsive promoter family protein [Marinilabiliaceae bacterium]